MGGTRFARQTAVSAWPPYDADFNKRAEMLSEAGDPIIVFGGTNGFGHGDAPLGKWGDNTVFTFYGACKCLFETLGGKYGKEKIIAETPLHRAGEDNPLGDGSNKISSAPLKDYVAAILKTAESMDIKALNLWGDMQLNPNCTGNEKYFADGLHSTDEGHVLICKNLADFLAKL